MNTCSASANSRAWACQPSSPSDILFVTDSCCVNYSIIKIILSLTVDCYLLLRVLEIQEAASGKLTATSRTARVRLVLDPFVKALLVKFVQAEQLSRYLARSHCLQTKTTMRLIFLIFVTVNNVFQIAVIY
jgi:hypothetical protein